MTAFNEFWEIPSFRASFTEFINFPQSSIQAVRDALGAGGLPSTPPEGSGVSSDEWLRARSMVRTLAAIRDDEGLAPLLGDIGQTIEGIKGVDGEQAINMTRQLLELDPETEQLNLIRRAQYSALPVLVNLSVEVDFRAVPSINDEGPTLAPVYIVRLTFDEDIAGSDAVVFQVPEDATEIVRRRLEEAKNLRASIAAKLPTALLHNQIRGEILDNG